MSDKKIPPSVAEFAVAALSAENQRIIPVEHPLQSCLSKNGEQIGMSATITQQAELIRLQDAEIERMRGPEGTVTSARGDKLFTFMAKDPCSYALAEVTYANPVRKLIAARDELRDQLATMTAERDAWIGRATELQEVVQSAAVSKEWPKQECPVTGAITDVDPADMAQAHSADGGMVKVPMQPIVIAGDGVVRFKENKMVSHLLDFAEPLGCGLNELTRMDFSQEDRMQFAQLIGYSVSGYGDLSYASDESVLRADAIAGAILSQTSGVEHE